MKSSAPPLPGSSRCVSCRVSCFAMCLVPLAVPGASLGRAQDRRAHIGEAGAKRSRPPKRAAPPGRGGYRIIGKGGLERVAGIRSTFPASRKPQKAKVFRVCRTVCILLCEKVKAQLLAPVRFPFLSRLGHLNRTQTPTKRACISPQTCSDHFPPLASKIVSLWPAVVRTPRTCANHSHARHFPKPLQ